MFNTYLYHLSRLPVRVRVCVCSIDEKNTKTTAGNATFRADAPRKKLSRWCASVVHCAPRCRRDFPAEIFSSGRAYVITPHSYIYTQSSRIKSSPARVTSTRTFDGQLREILSGFVSARGPEAEAGPSTLRDRFEKNVEIFFTRGLPSAFLGDFEGYADAECHFVTAKWLL
jgi:hypothetical protein